LEILQELSEPELVEELASLFLTVQEIEDILSFDRDYLRLEIQNPNSDFGRAYRRGVARTKIQLRFDTRKFAVLGSPQAMKDMLDNLSDQIMSENA
jgi:hypothetical protein